MKKYPEVVQGRCGLCKKEDMVCIKYKVGNPRLGFILMCDACHALGLKVIRSWPEKIQEWPNV